MNPWVIVTGWTLIHFVWQGALIAFATAAGLRFAKGRSPEIRYLLACLGLTTMVASPAVTATSLTATMMVSARAGIEAVERASEPSLAARSIAPPVAHSSTNDTTLAASAPSAAWLSYLVWAWLSGVSLLLVRFAGGSWRVHRIRAAAASADVSRWQAVARQIGERLGVSVPVRVVESALVDAPSAIGWIRPVVLLPLAVVTNLAPAQVEAILAHELAHIRRRDYVVNLLQTFTEAVLFYHPGVWWVSARIREEREQCCDDLAVRICGEPMVYAAALVELASHRGQRNALAVAATDGALLSRVRRLLRVPADDEPRSTTGLLVLALAVVVFAGAAVQSWPGAEGNVTKAVQSGAATWRRQTTDHFEIHYEADLDLHAERVASDAERAYEQVSSDLKHNLAFRVPVVIVRTTHELQQSAPQLPPPHVGSFSEPGRDRILLAIDRPADEWHGLLTHEVAHVFAFDIIPGSATPRWIAEGLAEYLRGAWHPSDLLAIRGIVRGNRIPALGTLDSGLGETDGRLIYGIGHAAFEFIESRWGKEGVRRFLFGLRQAALKATDAYEHAFRIPRSEFAKAFDQYLRERFANAAAQAVADRFDTAETLRLEGELIAVSSPVAAGLACIELWAGQPEHNRQRWAIECGDGPGADVVRALKPGDRVIVTGFPAKRSATRRMLIRTLVRPSDGFTWTV